MNPPPEFRIQLNASELACLSTLVEQALSGDDPETSLNGEQRALLHNLALKLHRDPPDSKSVHVARNVQWALGYLAAVLAIAVLPAVRVWYVTGSFLWTSTALALGAYFGVVSLGGVMGKVSWGMVILSLVAMLLFYGLMFIVLTSS
jgi:hypothetical protein